MDHVRLTALLRLSELQGPAARKALAASAAALAAYRTAHPGAPTDKQDEELVSFARPAPVTAAR
ncbi:MAG: hypothetical protein AAB295_02500 [Chloroflexota bacterium]